MVKEQAAVVEWLESDTGEIWRSGHFRQVGHNSGLYSIKYDQEMTAGWRRGADDTECDCQRWELPTSRYHGSVHLVGGTDARIVWSEELACRELVVFEGPQERWTVR